MAFTSADSNTKPECPNGRKLGKASASWQLRLKTRSSITSLAPTTATSISRVLDDQGVAEQTISGRIAGHRSGAGREQGRVFAVVR